MKPFAIKTLALAGAVGLGIGFTGQASATPDLEFVFQQDGGWVQGSENVISPISGGIDFSVPTAPPAPAGTFETISWLSASSPQSMLDLETQGNVSVFSDQGPFIISTLTHSNAVIPIGTNWSVRADTNSKLIAPDSTELFDFGTTSVTVNFLETENAAPCNDVFQGSSSNNLAGSTCDDIYSVLVSDIVQDGGFFDWGGETWELVFGLQAGAGTAFETVTDGGLDYFRVYASELGESVFNVTVAINQVPEPGTVALMSLGLGLVGWGARRRGNSRKA